MTVISPGLNLLEKTERLEVNLSGRADRRLYSKYGELNATDQFYEGTGRYLLTERFNVSGKVNYIQNSNPARDLETTGFAFTDVTRYRQNYGFGSNYMLSEILLATFSYDYLNDTYNNPRYSDMEAHVFDAGVVHDMSYFMQKTQARMNIGYARYNIPDFRVDNYEWTAGVYRALNEKWNIQLDAGLRHTKSRFTFSEALPTPPFFIRKYDNNEDWGGVGQLALAYKGLKNSGNIRIRQDIMPASGMSGTSDRTSFTFGFNMRLTYEFRWTLNGGYFINKSKPGQYSVGKIDQNSIWITPAIIYDYSKDTSINFSYTYNQTSYNTNDTNAERNVFQIRYRVQHELFN